MTRFISIILSLIVFISAQAASIETAKNLYEQGQYKKAIDELEQLHSKKPKDATINYYLGASYYEIGFFNAAKTFLKVAENANVANAARLLALINLETYDLGQASNSLERWEEILDKAKKGYPAEISEIRNRVIMVKNMLDRVEQIEVIDTLTVDSVKFFEHYKLSSDAGSLLDGFMLPDKYSEMNPKVVYMPESGKELFWSIPADGDKTTLVVADVLDDGEISEPRSIGDEINSYGTADFPFILQDGMTIYFGAKGEESLGGYDIFMTRRSADGSLLQPQNVGMPYNSLDNDYMMVIDETNNLGWWASDREHIPGMVTIYTFVPSKIRINHSPDSKKLTDYALMKNIEIKGNLEEHLKDEKVDDNAIEEFYFPLGNGEIYTHLAQFKNPQARQAMKNLLKQMFDIEVMQAQLEALRENYGADDKQGTKEILSLEKTLKEAPSLIERLTNQIISLENRTRVQR